MLSALAFALTLTTAEDMKMQIVPMSQNPFDRKQTILECSANDPYGIFILNDLGVSDKALEAVVNNPTSIQMVKLIRKEANGSLIAWLPSGKPTTINPEDIGQPNIEKMQDGEVFAILDSPFANFIQQMSLGKPAVQCTVAVNRLVRFVQGGNFQTLESLGTPTAKFGNIKFGCRITQAFESIPVTPGASKTIENVTLKIIGPIDDQKDKKDHLEIVQVGLPNLGSFGFNVVYDWDAYKKDNNPTNQRLASSSAKPIRKAGEKLDPNDMHFDVSSSVPVKYWKSISVFRSSSVQGYFGRIALAPSGS